MSVLVSHVTKLFGSQKAVDDLSFKANKGEILGFLGPNGAGKSTTMKMITGYYQPSSGEIEVCGIKVSEDPLKTKKLIGYLPENNPLYKDMYVREYLLNFARMSNIDHSSDRIEELIRITGLSKEQNKIIGTLSKGYKQRVGLSQAMLHNPEVLILDEPTSGLDPNQILEIRELIKQLGKEKTIIFSTHIMQEVKMLCDRVIIINNGKLVADDSIQNLQDQIQDKQIIHVEFKIEPALSLLKSIPGIDSIQSHGSGKFTIYSSSNQDMRDILSEFSAKNKLSIREMSKDKNSVEEVFTTLTKQNKN